MKTVQALTTALNASLSESFMVLQQQQHDASKRSQCTRNPRHRWIEKVGLPVRRPDKKGMETDPRPTRRKPRHGEQPCKQILKKAQVRPWSRHHRARHMASESPDKLFRWSDFLLPHIFDSWVYRELPIAPMFLPKSNKNMRKSFEQRFTDEKEVFECAPRAKLIHYRRDL